VFPLAHPKSTGMSLFFDEIDGNGTGFGGFFLFLFFVRLKIQRYWCFSTSGENINNVWPKTRYTRRHTKTSCLSMCGVSNISRTWSRWQNGNIASGSHDDGITTTKTSTPSRCVAHCTSLRRRRQSKSCSFSSPSFTLHIFIGYSIGD